MIVGIPREIKPDEYRVAIVPAGVNRLCSLGHSVLIEQGSGVGSGIDDNAFEKAGGKIVSNRHELFEQAEMILKVKEPLKDEFELIRENQIVFTYFHFAASKALTEAMLAVWVKSSVTRCIPERRL